jgi:hypothetical protein
MGRKAAMAWSAAIEWNCEALKRVLASLVAMAQSAVATGFLPRHRHSAVLRLLRPAEAAARRLIIVLAQGLAWHAPSKPARPTIAPSTDKTQDGRRALLREADVAAPTPRRLSLMLVDPLPRPAGIRRVPPWAAPRISVPGSTLPFPIPKPPSPHDPVDATRLGLRLAALASALDDLPGEARRFARWQARNHRSGSAARPRWSPLRPGRPPGGRLSRYDPQAARRRNIREVDEILAHCHALAVSALERRDTS